jgi:hypothetical protein
METSLFAKEHNRKRSSIPRLPEIVQKDTNCNLIKILVLKQAIEG